MTYRLSTDPDPPVWGEARDYLKTAGIWDAISPGLDAFVLADALYRLVGPDPKRVPEALAIVDRLTEWAKVAGLTGRFLAAKMITGGTMSTETCTPKTPAETKKAACVEGARRTAQVRVVVEELRIENAGRDPFVGLS